MEGFLFRLIFLEGDLRFVKPPAVFRPFASKAVHIHVRIFNDPRAEKIVMNAAGNSGGYRIGVGVMRPVSVAGNFGAIAAENAREAPSLVYWLLHAFLLLFLFWKIRLVHNFIIARALLGCISENGIHLSKDALFESFFGKTVVILLFLC